MKPLKELTDLISDGTKPFLTTYFIKGKPQRLGDIRRICKKYKLPNNEQEISLMHSSPIKTFSEENKLEFPIIIMGENLAFESIEEFELFISTFMNYLEWDLKTKPSEWRKRFCPEKNPKRKNGRLKKRTS